MITTIKVGILGTEVGEITISGPVYRGSELAAGYDLYCCEDVRIMPDGIKLVGTGVSWLVSMVPGTGLMLFGSIRERSGLALRGLNVGGGVIDADYRDEIGVICRNVGTDVLTLRAGTRIAQLITGFCVVGTDVNIKREGGFGSTGLC